MEEVKKTKEFKIFKKGSGRYCVTDAKGQWINGDKKVEILQGAGLTKPAPKKKAAPAAETAEKPAE